MRSRKLYAIETSSRCQSGDSAPSTTRNREAGAGRLLRTAGHDREPDCACRKSKLGRAIAYVRRHREALSRYASNGRLAIDNNASERGVKPMVIGRKDYLFAGNPDGGRAAATLYTMVESASVQDREPGDLAGGRLARVNDTPEHEHARSPARPGGASSAGTRPSARSPPPPPAAARSPSRGPAESQPDPRPAGHAPAQSTAGTSFVERLRRIIGRERTAPDAPPSRYVLSARPWTPCA
ncbi:MAG: transposase [Phycisphaeraceae bacterium]|nr:transposase [Phycisphaeraceae bacterium]